MAVGGLIAGYRPGIEEQSNTDVVEGRRDATERCDKSPLDKRDTIVQEDVIVSNTDELRGGQP
jgi:hypothetical protein